MYNITKGFKPAQWINYKWQNELGQNFTLLCPVNSVQVYVSKCTSSFPIWGMSDISFFSNFILLRTENPFYIQWRPESDSVLLVYTVGQGHFFVHSKHIN